MSKITKRSYKRKKIIMGAALFGAIGLVSTGFAAWVLSSSTSHDQAANLNVGTISDKNMSFSNVVMYETGDANKVEYNKFHFEPTANDFSGRVRAEAGGQKPVLSLSVDAQLNQAQNLGLLTARISVSNNTVAPGEEAPAAPNSNGWTTNFATAVEKGYIVAPEAISETITLYNYNAGTALNPGNVVFSNENTVANFTYVVEFQWGAFFAGMNPSEFFDNSDPEKKNSAEKVGTDYSKEEVKDILVELHDLLDTVNLTLTLQADPN